jgi:hypothetical protein
MGQNGFDPDAQLQINHGILQHRLMVLLIQDLGWSGTSAKSVPLPQNLFLQAPKHQAPPAQQQRSASRLLLHKTSS